MFLAAFIGPSKMGLIDYVYDPIHAATYNAFAPIGWCGLFLWMAVTQHTGSSNGNYWKDILIIMQNWYSANNIRPKVTCIISIIGFLNKLFSWRGFLITTRISYAIYLTQFPIYFYNVGQTRTAEQYEFFKIMVRFKKVDDLKI